MSTNEPGRMIRAGGSCVIGCKRGADAACREGSARIGAPRTGWTVGATGA